MKIRRNGSIASVKGSAEYFTGTVRIDTPFSTEAPARAFTAKGRFANMLSAVPVHVIMVNAALLGAAMYGLEQVALWDV